jgi:hypothetical protein
MKSLTAMEIYPAWVAISASGDEWAGDKWAYVRTLRRFALRALLLAARWPWFAFFSFR